MQTSDFGKSKGLWQSLSEGTLSDAFDGLGISLLLTANPSIQVYVSALPIQTLLLSKYLLRLKTGQLNSNAKCNAMQYTVFDQLKNRLLKGNMRKQGDDVSSVEALSAFSAFVLGAVSKCIATCLTYPAIR